MLLCRMINRLLGGASTFAIGGGTGDAGDAPPDTTAPTITSGNPSGSFDEGAAVGGTLTADESVTWSKSGADAGAVTLDPDTGVWSLETTDYETKTSYAWTFTATDAADNSSNQNVAIAINDLDEVNPTITSGNPSGSYDEGAAVGGTLTADESVTWSKSGTDAGAVTLDPDTGVWSLETTDYESQTSYAWTFTATDAADNSSNQNVAIAVNDVAEGSFDYVINNDADWGTIPGGLLTGGGSIGVAPGNYTAKTFTATPSALLSFEPTVPGSWPTIDKMTFGNLTNIKMTGLKFITTAWGSSPQSAVTFGVSGGTAVLDGVVDLDGNIIQGNYRGDPDEYDTFDFTTDDVPEYACIHAVVTGGVYPVGDITANIFNSYVGDLVADGTGIPLSANLGGGSGFAGFMNVSGGHIVYAEITNGGSGYTGYSNPHNTIGWTGRTPFIDQMPACVGGKANLVAGATFHLRNNDFRFALNGFKLSAFTIQGSLYHENNDYDGIYMDAYASPISGANKPERVRHAWNRMSRFFCKVGDANDPHPDGIQHWLPDNDDWVPEVELIGNEVLVSAASRGNGGQSFFITQAGTQAYEVHAVGNAGMMIASNGLMINLTSNSFIYGNTLLPGQTDNAAHTGAVKIRVSDNSGELAYGQSYVGYNIYEQLGVGAAAGARVQQDNNVSTGIQTDANPAIYTTIFGDNTPPATIAEMRTKRKATGSYADKGAYRDASWIDHAARTYDRSLEPSFIRFPTVINQALSGTATSGWAKLLGGPDSQSVSISGGTFDTATHVDLSGTPSGVTSGQTSATLARGTWIRVNVATAATGSTATTATLTVRGTYNFTFTAITQVVASYTIADNQDAAYSRISTLPTVSNIARILVAARFRMDSYTNLDNIFANSNAANLRLHWSANQWRFIADLSSSISARWGMSQSAGSMITLLTAVDLTQTESERALLCVENGNQKALASSGVVYNNSDASLRLSNSDLWPSSSLGLFASGGGGNIMDGAFEWLWMDLFTDAEGWPDILDPATIAEFSADKFNADGSTGVLGQPLFFYKGADLTEWNGTITNGGSASGADLVKLTGTYV